VQYAANPQPYIDRVKKWQQDNPERLNEYRREYRQRPERKAADREGYLKRKYGMTIADYERMFEAQGGICAICGEARPEERTLHIDHDHETGVIRGLLCFRCNNALGDFREEYELFQRAADYLDRDDGLAALVQERAGALTG
jgi:Recombination endonuclease VII